MNHQPINQPSTIEKPSTTHQSNMNSPSHSRCFKQAPCCAPAVAPPTSGSPRSPLGPGSGSGDAMWTSGSARTASARSAHNVTRGWVVDPQ